ncbi:MAG TPA: hypothetical protein VK427_10255, partial [Kofleriaceae bacterium]|nr:hypothetical protein [Kofleriaceae bacterium]
MNLRFTDRAVLVRDGAPVRALAPGRYTFWRTYDVVRWNTDELVFTGPAAVVAALPSEWYETVRLGAGQYGIVLRDDRPVAFLRPGVHRIWKVEANVTLRVYDDKEPLPELTDELRKVIPASELLEVTIELNQRAVLLRDGVPDRVLVPGHYAFWGRHNKLALWNIDALVFTAAPDVLAVLPTSWYQVVLLGVIQRAVVLRDERPASFLRPGRHLIWTINPGVAVQIYDVTEPAPELTDELRAVIPANEIVEAQVKQFERALKYVTVGS